MATNEYYRKNRDRILASAKAKREANRETTSRRAKLYNETYFKQPIKRAKHIWWRARQRHKNGECPLTLDRVERAVVAGKCERTGLPFDFTSHPNKRFNPWSPSIDKIDPFGDYTNDNVQIVCTAYNFAKNQFSDDEFINFCRLVVAADNMRRNGQ